MNIERTLSSQTLHKGNLLEYRLDRVSIEGVSSEAERELILHPGGVVILACNADGEFIMVRQYRYAIGDYLLEFPAGRLNPGENPQMAALRELKEETGYQANQIHELGYIYTAPGFCSEKLYMYFADDLVAGESEPDEDEFVSVEHLTAVQITQKIQAMELSDAKTLAIWTMFSNLSDKLP